MINMNPKILGEMLNACKNGNWQIVDDLLKDMSVDDSNYLNENNETFLMIAAGGGGWYRIVTSLVKHGVNVNLKNKEGVTAMQKAARKGYRKAAEYLIKHGGALVESEDNDGNNVLHITSQNPDLVDKSMLTFLIDVWNERKFDIDKTNKYGDTPLHVAASCGNPEAVKKLLEKGANCQLKNYKNETVLQKAALHSKVLEILLKHMKEHHIDIVDSPNADGDNPAHIAAKAGNHDALKLLIENGGLNLLMIDNSGTCLFLLNYIHMIVQY